MVKAKIMKHRVRSAITMIPAGVFGSHVWAAETLFKGTSIQIPQSFVCGSPQPAGSYDLTATYEPKPQERIVLTVSKQGKSLCDVRGTTTSDYQIATNKVRVFTRVNGSLEAVQINLVLPSGIRSRVPNQVFYLPLSKN